MSPPQNQQGAERDKHEIAEKNKDDGEQSNWAESTQSNGELILGTSVNGLRRTSHAD